MANTRKIRQRQVHVDLEHRKSSKASVVLAGLAILPLMMAGQPWGVTYGLGLRVAKGCRGARIGSGGDGRALRRPATACEIGLLQSGPSRCVC